MKRCLCRGIAQVGNYYIAYLLLLHCVSLCACRDAAKTKEPLQHKVTANAPAAKADTNTPCLPIVTLTDTCRAQPLVIAAADYGRRYPFNDNVYTIKPASVAQADVWASVTNYSAEQGLFSVITKEYTDRQGNIWFGTDGAGVVCYNGQAFTTYTVAQGLGSNTIMAIAQDSLDNMWFGTPGAGVTKFDGRRFTIFSIRDKGIYYDNNTICSIMPDAAGNMWFGTMGGGLSRYDGHKYTAYNTHNGMGKLCNTDCIGTDVVTNMLDDGNGGIWVCLGGGGLSHYEHGKFTNYYKEDGLGANIVTCAIKDRQGLLWFGTPAGMSRYDGHTFTTITTADGLVNNNVTAMLQDDMGAVWIATDAGLSRYYNGQFATYTTSQGLASDKITSLAQDRSGNLWIGTAGGGASRYDRAAITSFTTKQGLPVNAITAITEDTAGNIWLGTAGEGICRYNGSTFTTYGTAQGLPFGWVESVSRDRDNNIWTGTAGTGASRFDGSSFTTWNVWQGVADGTVYAILHDSHGATWLATNDGVSRLAGDTIATYRRAQGLCGKAISCMAEDMQGNIWFGSAGSGISRFDGRSFTNFTTAQGLPSNTVTALLADKSGKLWIGSGNAGVARYDGKSFMRYSMANGLGSDVITAIAEDHEGGIWLGTLKGFSCISGFKDNEGAGTACRMCIADTALPNDAIAQRYKPVVAVYNFRNGYPVRDVRPGSMYIDHKDVLWAGTGDRLVRFDRRYLYRDTAPPQLNLHAVKLNGQTMVWQALLKTKKAKARQPQADSMAMVNESIVAHGTVLPAGAADTLSRKYTGVTYDSVGRYYPIPYGLVLPYRHNSITIDFAATDPSRSYLVKYRYMLDGDDTWGQLTTRTSVTYGNIHEGTHTFSLQAQGPDGVWGSPLTYTFRVLPPWYRTWWAYALYILVVGLIVYTLLRWRTRQLSHDKERLELVVVERTADVVREKNEVEKQKRSVEELLDQKDMLMKEIHHRVKNNLQVISTLLDLQLNTVSDEHARKALTQGISRISSISLIHKHLYHNDAVANIAIAHFVNELMQQITAVFKSPGQQVQFTNSISAGMTLDIDTAIPLGLILNELITNSYKYAFPGVAGAVSINIEPGHNGYILHYHDSGPGLPAGIDIKHSTTLGMTVITSLSRQLGGSFSYMAEQKLFVVQFKGKAMMEED